MNLKKHCPKIILALALGLSPGAHAESSFWRAETYDQATAVQPGRYFHNFLRIPVQAGRELIRTDQQGLRRNLLVGGGIVAAFALDKTIRDFAQDSVYAGDNAISVFLHDVGTVYYAAPAIGLAYGVSLVTRDRKLHDTTVLSVQSLLITQVFTHASKTIVGRDRPRQSPGNPFRRGGGDAFFSGHASGTWSVATVVAQRYPRTKWLSYGLATAVAAARIYEDAHWTSDVLVGSIVGYGIGRLTVRLNRNPEANQLAIVPWLDQKTQAMFVQFSF